MEQQADMQYQDYSTGSPNVSLITSSSPGIQPLDGNYSVLLQGSIASVSISQTGTIPANTQSILFDAEGGPRILDVMIGTQDIPFSAVGSGPNYTVYGANLSAWAGNTETLTFSALADSATVNNWLIDDISFSPSAVPEPNPVALTAMGGILFGVFRLSRRKGL